MCLFYTILFLIAIENRHFFDIFFNLQQKSGLFCRKIHKIFTNQAVSRIFFKGFSFNQLAQKRGCLLCKSAYSFPYFSALSGVCKICQNRFCATFTPLFSAHFCAFVRKLFSYLYFSNVKVCDIMPMYGLKWAQKITKEG